MLVEMATLQSRSIDSPRWRVLPVGRENVAATVKMAVLVGVVAWATLVEVELPVGPVLQAPVVPHVGTFPLRLRSGAAVPAPAGLQSSIAFQHALALSSWGDLEATVCRLAYPSHWAGVA